MNRGRVLAFDPGSKRIGVAVSDALRIVATPVGIIDADDPWDEIAGLIEEYSPEVVVVGLPISLDGSEGPAAARARSFGEELEHRHGRPVEYVDERYTTQTAEAALIEGRVRRRDRKQAVDKVAAAVILRHYLTANP